MTYTPPPPSRPATLLGSRIAIDEYVVDIEAFECTACGASLRGIREILAYPTVNNGYTTYALVHNDLSCIRVVT